MAFSTISLYKSSLCSQVSSWAQMDRRNLLQKYHIKISLLKAVVRSNILRIAYNYSKCTAQSKTSSSGY